MGFDARHNDRYLALNRERWRRVAADIAKAKGIEAESPAMMRVRRAVIETRFEIAFAAKDVIPKASRIADYHCLIDSTPQLPMIRRRHFTGLRLRDAARIITDHLVAGKPPADIRSTILPYFIQGRPQHIRECVA